MRLNYDDIDYGNSALPSMLINGVETSHVSVMDRGLQYGDGLFETIRVMNGIPLFWQPHIDRLMSGCESLYFPLPDRAVLQTEAMELCDNINEGVLKIIITRGMGGRGYRMPEEASPTRIMIMYPAPDYANECWEKGVMVRVCNTRLGLNPQLAGLKHLNRLEQVMARAEWSDPGIHEGLMLDTENHVIEGTMSNVFYVKEGDIITPDLSRCGVKGIVREQILGIAGELKMSVHESKNGLENLYDTDEIMLTNSVIGIWPVRQLEKQQFTVGPVYQRLREALDSKKHGWEDVT